MKLPRWLVMSMFTTSVLAVLGCGAWWCVTWPERTAEKLTGLLRDWGVDQINAMIYQHDRDAKYYASETDVLHIGYRLDNGTGGYSGHSVGMPRHVWVARFQNRVAERRSTDDLLSARTTLK